MSDFMQADGNLAIFELSGLSNTAFKLQFTQMVVDTVFRLAGDQGAQSVCHDMEDAHTVVPETTTPGDLGNHDSNKALIDEIGQAAPEGLSTASDSGSLRVKRRTSDVLC